MGALHPAGLILSVLLAAAPAFAQRELAGAAEIRQALGRLKNTGSALMIGAHPDDENTAVLAWLARGRKVRAGYLSLTRGEGGQNLIGPEQGDLLGVIRTQELLAARRIDGAEQFFTRAIDFGFSKTAAETLEKWGHEDILSDVVWTIRRFRPDVVILRFSGTARDGHGHHQASAKLGKEAFTAAADPNRFPEQLRWVRPWQARRLLWNVFSFTAQQERDAEKMGSRIEIDAGQFDPVLGHSYGEIAGMSRSQHRSQGMGAPERRGSQKNFFVNVAGDPASRDMFDGIDTTWRRIPDGAKVAGILDRADSAFDAEHPERSLPALAEARALVAAMRDPVAMSKLAEIDEAIALCAGLWLDASSAQWSATPGSTANVNVTAIDRGAEPVSWTGLRLEGIAGAPAITDASELACNIPATRTLAVSVPAAQPYSQPYWLAKPKSGARYTVDNQELIGLPQGAPVLDARFLLSVAGARIEVVRPVQYRYVDHVLGELTRPFEVVPPVAIRMPETALVLPSAEPRTVEVSARANAKGRGVLRLAVPEGWKVEPAEQPFALGAVGEQATVTFRVTPPAGETVGKLRATAQMEGGATIASAMTVIDYPHIPVQTLFPRAAVPLVHTAARTLARTVGYVMGAGDEEPAALRQLGCDVTLLSAEDLARGDLARFDAIVTGVRAYNVRADLRANQQRLLDYVKNGGTMVVQYNVLEGGPGGGGDSSALSHIGPYPIRITRDRVTVEEAPVRFPDPSLPLLHKPNDISEKDFAGWIQERGLYFAGEWAPEYRPVFETHDPGEKPLEGGTLYARYGKGAYIFTAFSWFRELPAGVPGAYRIFANFISAGKTQ